jgi:hypothetical protein
MLDHRKLAARRTSETAQRNSKHLAEDYEGDARQHSEHVSLMLNRDCLLADRWSRFTKRGQRRKVKSRSRLNVMMGLRYDYGLEAFRTKIRECCLWHTGITS